MFERIRRKEKTTYLDDLIKAVLNEMERIGVYSEEYQHQMENLERLHKLKAETRRNLVSPDTIAIVAGNLLGILVIVIYEQKHVMTSKGLNQILRPTRPNTD